MSSGLSHRDGTMPPCYRDKYRMVKKLGAGSFGKVYVIAERATGKEFVLKDVALPGKGPERKQALAEVDFLRQLDHPCVIKILEYTLVVNDLFIVMEYASAGDMDERITAKKKQRGRFSEKQIMDWLVQLIMALVHIHSKKILHRDIKTQNLFLTGDGNTVKIGDFGVARNLKSSFDAARKCPCKHSPPILTHSSMPTCNLCYPRFIPHS